MIRFIELLVEAGLREIEATSFVSPKAIPQLADADELVAGLPSARGVRFPFLVPNGGPGAINESQIHIDFMIGSPELRITGITSDGERVPVLHGGRWQL